MGFIQFVFVFQRQIAARCEDGFSLRRSGRPLWWERLPLDDVAKDTARQQEWVGRQLTGREVNQLLKCN